MLVFALLLTVHTVRAEGKEYLVRDIILIGNKTTKDYIILRELPIKINDTLNEFRMEKVFNRCRENLENLHLFNYVRIFESFPDKEKNTLIINIHVEERWYIWPLVNVYLENRNMSTWLKDWDLSRITVESGFKIDNCLGLNHKLIASLKLGYQKALYFGYRNISPGSGGRHFFSLSIEAMKSHNLDYITKNNAPLHLKENDKILEQSVEAKLYYVYRHSIRTTHNIDFIYNHTRLDPLILESNPHYWGDPRTEHSSFRLNYFYCQDQRDYHVYPLEGFYVKAGFNTYVTDNRSVYALQIEGSLQYYLPLGRRWYASSNLTVSKSFKNADSWILDRAIGYDNNILRGYEYYVADGQAFVVSNNTIKFNMLPKTIVTLNRIAWLSKFYKIHFSLYAKAHFDMGYAWNKFYNSTNLLSNQFLYAGGIGIDIVTYYDIILGFDYSINKQGQSGFYFSFKLPIN